MLLFTVYVFLRNVLAFSFFIKLKVVPFGVDF